MRVQQRAKPTEKWLHPCSCPIGFKNGTDGNVDIAIDALRAARNRHLLLSPDHKEAKWQYTKHQATSRVISFLQQVKQMPEQLILTPAFKTRVNRMPVDIKSSHITPRDNGSQHL